MNGKSVLFSMVESEDGKKTTGWRHGCSVHGQADRQGADVRSADRGHRQELPRISRIMATRSAKR